jgi:hypothetical protein
MFDTRNMSRAEKNKWFDRFFWVSIVVGGLLILAVVLLGLWMGLSLMVLHNKPEDVDVGVAIATGALALFTALLWFAAALTARFARTEISTSTAVNSANLTLQLDNRFNSDRALRIRHGAVMFLAEKWEVHIDCDHEISPYFDAPNNRWNKLTSDLIDLFNFFDWIGYLTSEEIGAIDREMLRRRLGPWIITYYDMCEEELDYARAHYADRWIHLGPFYEDLLARRKKWYDENNKQLPPAEDAERNTKKEVSAFLQREHVRTHRGFDPSSYG